jgi:membrane fusion protein (multidrug efflux system)
LKEPSANEFTAGAEPAQASAMPTRAERLARLRLPLMLGGVAVVAVAAVAAWFNSGRYQSTDDAYVRVAGVDVSSNLAGRVVEVDVKENQQVKAGQVLFRLDPQPYVIAVEAARAQVADARQQLQGDLARYGQRQVELKNAQDAAAYAERERKREQSLQAAGAVSQAEYDQAKRAADAARLGVGMAQQQLAQAVAALGGRPDQSVDGHASVREANAQLARAHMQNEWTVIRAPQEGRVTKVEQLQVGNYINAATPVFHLVTDRFWIDAAFKENQLRHMRPGQSATIKLDAYPSYKCKGVVDSLAPGTDQTFSMMPAENASGNWVKVVQRLPVRMHFSCDPPLAPQGGLSARVKVDTNYRHTLFGGSK